MHLYLKYVWILFKSQTQYRLSFWMLALGQALTPLTVFAGLYFMFAQFGQVKGWSFYEAALCYAIIGLSFALAETFARGFDMFSTLVTSGDFDRLLVRPRSTILQVLGSRFEFARLGRMLQSLIVLIWSLNKLPLALTAPKLFTLTLMIVCGMLIFTGIFIATASLSFWTIQGLEVANVFTDGGREMAKYPLSIYEKWVAYFFTFVIPLGCVNYLPLLYVLGRTSGSNILYMLSPLAGIVFFLPCLFMWHIGVRHYRSTGS
ncbi:ABC-2 family transporter protein [Paenibacillus glycanilyticus]|uniref:ABC transporter permease n=1 Tax=Paenibacillus glycanilyticus TaxID=126569 RepID=UPI00204032C7|nr:ABC-2 family transporter protein [Paenibacillus glycanilyticus]MCM3630185.1 ABC-2 family transporter protein [Paenibacillus glycanilyticus]